jgi:Mg2+ and Co2+ transporter CorA
MNVGLPAGDHPFAFYWMAGVSIGIAVMIGFIFWRKRWL